MLKIRLSRIGKNKKPSYKIIVSEHTKDTVGDYLELLGNYNPAQKPKILEVKADRIKYWISKGAQCSPTIYNLLVDKKIIEGKKTNAFTLKKTQEAKPAEGEAKAA